jgi:hypothetical protein
MRSRPTELMLCMYIPGDDACRTWDCSAVGAVGLQLSEKSRGAEERRELPYNEEPVVDAALPTLMWLGGVGTRMGFAGEALPAFSGGWALSAGGRTGMGMPVA